MPNVETENKNNAPRKNKNKSLAVTTEKDVSSLSQETFSPSTPAIESGDSALENVNKNPYLDVIIKRLRKLKKVMRNVEKYEAIQNSSDPEVVLIDEQIKVLERKGETSGAIKEFESTYKQMELVEKEELRKQAELKKAQQVERDQAIADAVEKVKATHSKSLLQLILFFRLAHFQQRGIVQLPDNEFEAVETLRAKLTTLSEEAENDESYEEKIRQVLDLVDKLNSGDESLILPNGAPETDQVASSGEDPSSYGISYSQLRSLIKNPPILESTADQEESNETFEIINTSSEHIEVTTEYNTGLQFMRPDDQSQPQALDNTINNTTFGFQSTDAEQTPVEETIVDVNVQEQYSQQQNYETYTVEQHFTVEQQQYIGEQQQQQFNEQEDQQQVSTEQEELPQQQEEPPAQESQTISEDQADSKQPQATSQQNSNQPPPLTQGPGGHRGRYNRGNRGHRGQGSRRESGGYGNYGGGYYRGDGNYGNYRGRGLGPRGGRGGGFQGNRGTPYKQRSQ